MPVDYLVAGLGNPGDRYTRTRHNLGFRAVEALVRRRGARWGKPSKGLVSARADIAGNDVLVIEPLTYMNLSGDVVAPLVTKESLPLNRLLVVCDDFALPLGTLRLRKGGTDGGHNGLASIIDRLSTIDFARLRLGVGPVPPRVDPAEFVLAEFLPEEEAAVEETIAVAADCIEAWVTLGVERAMSRFNARKEAAPPEDPGGI
ncbi:MAG TPA: aminoacyl-tRNA hydrolase [Candidatus Krumholzibacteria bacterium]|nr:aminoacyl-tRNA hydrolase [Candidatus Krumholzibacteria bacterium]